MASEAELSKIIEEETLKFKGVSRFADPGLADNITKAVRPRDFVHPSIKIAEDEGEYTINLEILVHYGVNIPQLCYDIQTGLIHSMMERAGIVVKTVNIRVEGIDEA